MGHQWTRDAIQRLEDGVPAQQPEAEGVKRFSSDLISARHTKGGQFVDQIARGGSGECDG
jgi:hypothetical protein